MSKKKTPLKGHYSYVPAALNPTNFGGLGLYTRYGKTGVNGIELVEQTPDTTWIKTPDRDLVFVGDTNMEHSWTPSAGTFDDFLNLSVFHEESAKDFGLDYFMTNFTEFIGPRDRKSPNLRRSGKRPDGTPLIISDSGGFQLLTGKLSYVDPLEAVNWYNRNVDIGIVLDIPPVGANSEVLMRMAKIQKKNTDLMLKNKAEHLELMNIFHGNTMKERQQFRKVVEDDRIDRLAIGGSYNRSLLLSIYDLMLIAHSGKEYKQYHILGVTNMLQVVGLMRLTEKGLIKHVTSDSSTHIQKAFKKEYLHQAQLTSNIVHLQIGRKHVKPSIGNRLPCSCPVCARVRYTDVFSMYDGKAVNGVMAWHNMFFYNEYITRMRDIVTLPIKELTHVMEKQLGSRHGIKEAVDSLKFIDAVEQLGLKEAGKKYSFFIEHSVEHQEEVSLFEGVKADDTSAEYRERLMKIIETYESGGSSVNKREKVKLRVKRSQAKSRKKKVRKNGKRK